MNFKSIPLVLANSENGDEDDDRGSSASVQFMITNKMKKMLVNDLGYSLGEVQCITAWSTFVSNKRKSFIYIFFSCVYQG